MEVDELEDAEAVRLCGAPTADGARARTFVALVAAVARDFGGRVVIVAVLQVEEEELWCWARPVIILATAALPYVPGHGGGTCGCSARLANGARLRRRGMPLHVEKATISLSGAPFGQGPAAVEEIPPFAAMGASDDPDCPLRVPHQPAEGEREAGAAADNRGAVFVEVHGGDGAPTVIMFVVPDVNRGVRPLDWPRPCCCAPGGAGWRCCQYLVAEVVQPLNVGAVPRAIVPDILGNQDAQCVEREVVGLCFASRRSCAEWT